MKVPLPVQIDNLRQKRLSDPLTLILRRRDHSPNPNRCILDRGSHRCYWQTVAQRNKNLYILGSEDDGINWPLDCFLWQNGAFPLIFARALFIEGLGKFFIRQPFPCGKSSFSSKSIKAKS